MAEDPGHGDGERGGAPMLEYRSAKVDRVPISGVQALDGFIGGMLIMGGGTLGGVFASLGVQTAGHLVWICFVCSGVVVNLLATVNYCRSSARGYGVGLWIGFGVAAVGFGGCLSFGR